MAVLKLRWRHEDPLKIWRKTERKRHHFCPQSGILSARWGKWDAFPSVFRFCPVGFFLNVFSFCIALNSTPPPSHPHRLFHFLIYREYNTINGIYWRREEEGCLSLAVVNPIFIFLEMFWRIFCSWLSEGMSGRTPLFFDWSLWAVFAISLCIWA